MQVTKLFPEAVTSYGAPRPKYLWKKCYGKIILRVMHCVS